MSGRECPNCAEARDLKIVCTTCYFDWANALDFFDRIEKDIEKHSLNCNKPNRGITDEI